MTNTLFTEKIKEQTLLNHQQLEKELVARMRNLTSLQEYAALLNLFYSYFGSLEVAVQQYLNLAELPDYPQRRKTESLVIDIHDLGGQTNDLATAIDLPKIGSNLQALGALYVMEGSTLGGSHISKMLAGRLTLPGQKGLTFFNSYGTQTESMWMCFKQSMNRQVTDDVAGQEVIAAANATFEGFKKWIDKNG